MNRSRHLLVPTMTVLALAGCSATAQDTLGDEQVAADWCARVETATEAETAYDADPEDLDAARAYEQASIEALAEPRPDSIAESLSILTNDADLPEDPDLQDQLFFDAVRDIGQYAEDECGLTP